MKKRLFGILFAVLLCLSLSVPAFAQGNMPLLVDNADLLTDSEESALLSKLANISSNQQMDIVIVTVNDLDGETPRDYADDFYDFNCYAEDGVLLLISMENSDWYISTSGYGITAVTDAGREYMAEQFVDDLGDGDYYDAFVTYADLCDEFINMARSGDPFDVDDLPKEDFHYIRSLLVSLGIGLVVALIIIGRMKGKLKTVRRQAEAADYGIVAPRLSDMVLEKPEVFRQGNKYGVRMTAKAPCFHIIRTTISTEVSPVVGTESQSEDLAAYLIEQFGNEEEDIWETNLFGKSLKEMVTEQMESKVNNVPIPLREKVQRSLQRISDEGKDYFICIIL